jgi:nitroreductase
MKMEKYLNRSSIKKFTGKKMIDKDVELLSKIINNSPTSENHQLFSAIIIRNQKTLD